MKRLDTASIAQLDGWMEGVFEKQNLEDCWGQSHGFSSRGYSLTNRLSAPSLAGDPGQVTRMTPIPGAFNLWPARHKTLKTDLHHTPPASVGIDRPHPIFLIDKQYFS